jgi:hypothetical protein
MLLLYVCYKEVSSDVSAIECLLSPACFGKKNVPDDGLTDLRGEQMRLPEFEA